MRYMLLIYAEESTMPPPSTGADATTSDTVASGVDAASAVDATTDATTADAAAAIAPWTAYTRSLIEKDVYRGADQLADSTTATSVRVRNGHRVMTDGPFAETREVLGGYYIVECDDLDAALDAAAACPAATYGTIEVRPLVDMPTGA